MDDRAAEELESLGKWSEPGTVGPGQPEDRKVAGIFELRTLSSLSGFESIPILMDAFCRYVVALNRGEEAYVANRDVPESKPAAGKSRTGRFGRKLRQWTRKGKEKETEESDSD
jgi:hypothetical protein